MKLATLSIGLVVLATPCLAEIPQYDIAVYCDEQARAGETIDDAKLRSCTSIEELALKQIMPVWDSLPAALQRNCDKTATFLGAGSYSLLQTCIQMKAN